MLSYTLLGLQTALTKHTHNYINLVFCKYHQNYHKQMQHFSNTNWSFMNSITINWIDIVLLTFSKLSLFEIGEHTSCDWTLSLTGEELTIFGIMGSKSGLYCAGGFADGLKCIRFLLQDWSFVLTIHTIVVCHICLLLVLSPILLLVELIHFDQFLDQTNS